MMRTLESVVIHRATPPEYNEAGEQISAGGETEILTNAWVIRFRDSLEFSEGRQNMVTRGTALFPPGSDVRATDEITAYKDFSPIRARVVGVFPVICARTRREKHLHTDLEAVS